MATPKQEIPSGSDILKTVNCAWQDADVARKYASAERATRRYCKIIIEKSGLAQTNSDAYIFDLATGTGAAVKELYDAVPKKKWGQLKVLGGDISPSMLGYLKSRGEKEGWTGLETHIIDGNILDLPANTYTHIFVSFALFGMPNALPKLYELLKPGGFIGVTTWASLTWGSLLTRSVEQMKDKPYCPSPSELEEKIYAGRAWGEKEYVASQLSEAGFQKVDAVREKNWGECGTPAEFMETMQFGLKLVTAYWEENKRDEWLKELNELMLKQAIAEFGGEDKQVRMEFDGNVGWGWKSG